MDLTMENSDDPWNMEVKITLSASLIQHFQDWDQTKSSVKKLCSFNRCENYTQYGPIKNSRIKNQPSDFGKK